MLELGMEISGFRNPKPYFIVRDSRIDEIVISELRDQHFPNLFDIILYNRVWDNKVRDNED